MSIKEMAPGEQLTLNAYPTTWGVGEVDVHGESKLQAIITFGIAESDETVTWKEFFTKRDGTPNIKTLKTLVTCGFRGSRLSDFGGNASLDADKLVTLQVIKDDKGYLKVEWVNEPGSGGHKLMDAQNAAKKLAALRLDDALGELIPKSKPAPKPEPKKTQSKAKLKPIEEVFPQDDDDDLPF
jgi:hypothetical protein